MGYSRIYRIRKTCSIIQILHEYSTLRHIRIVFTRTSVGPLENCCRLDYVDPKSLRWVLVWVTGHRLQISISVFDCLIQISTCVDDRLTPPTYYEYVLVRN